VGLIEPQRAHSQQGAASFLHVLHPSKDLVRKYSICIGQAVRTDPHFELHEPHDVGVRGFGEAFENDEIEPHRNYE
jgi:hypothetical protein